LTTEAIEADFVDRVYEAAVESDRWGDVLARFTAIMGGAGSNLTFQNQVTGRGHVLVHETDPNMFDRYFGYFATRNPLLRIRDFPVAPRVMTDEHKLPKEEFLRGEYYNDFLRDMDAHSILILRLAVDGDATTVMNVFRPARRDAFDGHAVATASRLHPHLVRAARLSSKISSDRTTLSGLDSLFAQSATAMFLVNSDAVLRRSNCAGEKLLAARAGIVVRQGVLCAVEGDASRRLHALIGAAGDPERQRRSGGSMSIPRHDRTLPLSATVIPARSERVSLFDPEPCVLVCLVNPEADIPAQDAVLREVLGLSRAECQVALELLKGCSTREVARNLDLSYNTVRAHLARIMAKTGTHRQSELVSLILKTART